MSAQRTIRISLAILASGASLALSWPYWRDFGYWPETRAMWLAYFVLGFVLAVYAFLGSRGTLFEHDAPAERFARRGTRAALMPNLPLASFAAAPSHAGVA